MKIEKNKENYITYLFVIFAVLLFIFLRIRWTGHILLWDEAMNLCSVQAFKTGIHNDFSYWMWHHPPTFNFFTLLLHPLQPDFDLRTEFLLIIISTINLYILFMLNKKVYNTITAIASMLMLAIMPAGMLFDVWIKRDAPVTTFGLLAILALISNRKNITGILLGIALLFKETATFYIIAILFMWLAGAAGKQKIKDLIPLFIIPAIIGGLWYLLAAPHFVTSISNVPNSSGYTGLFAPVIQHLRFAAETNNVFHKPWNFYFKLIPFYTGRIGTILVLTGIIVLFLNIANKYVKGKTETDYPAKLWPVFLLFPALLVLSISNAKVPWIVIVLLPALATLQGAVIALFINKCFLLKRKSTVCICLVIPAAIFGIMLVQAIKLDYDTTLSKIAPSQLRGANYSRQIAQAVNKISHSNDKILYTTFHYWKGLKKGKACPIFSFYLNPNLTTFVCPHQSTFSEVTNIISTEKINIAVLSPAPGKQEIELFGGFDRKLHASPVVILPKAYIYRIKEE